MNSRSPKDRSIETNIRLVRTVRLYLRASIAIDAITICKGLTVLSILRIKLALVVITKYVKHNKTKCIYKGSAVRFYILDINKERSLL